MNFERSLRIFHRWISLPVALFMAGIAITGIILHLQLIENPPGQGQPGPTADGPSGQDIEGPPVPPASADAAQITPTRLSRVDAETLLSVAYEQADAISAVRFDVEEGAPTVTVVSPDGAESRFDGIGASVPLKPAIAPMSVPAARAADLGPGPGAGPGGPSDASMKAHKFMMSLHTGDFMGPWGKYVAILCGLALVILSASGLWMYLQMFLRRFQQGRKGLFWS